MSDQTAVKNAERLSRKVSDYQTAETAKLVEALGRLAQGNTDCSVQTGQGDADTADARKTFETLSTALNTCIGSITTLVADAGALVTAAVEGRLATRADVTKHQGDYRKIVEGVNKTLDAVIGPLNVAAEYVDQISKGVIPAEITDSYAGDFNTIKNNLNTCIAWFKELVTYITAMANGDMTATMNKASAKDQIHEWLMLLKASLGAVVDDANTLVKAVVDGKLSVRADAGRHNGEYRRIVEGLNNTLEAVVTPLNVAGEMIEASRRVT